MKEIQRKDLKEGHWYLMRETCISGKFRWHRAQVEKIENGEIHLNHKIRLDTLSQNRVEKRGYYFYKLPDLEEIVYNGGRRED